MKLILQCNTEPVSCFELVTLRLFDTFLVHLWLGSTAVTVSSGGSFVLVRVSYWNAICARICVLVSDMPNITRTLACCIYAVYVGRSWCFGLLGIILWQRGKDPSECANDNDSQYTIVYSLQLSSVVVNE